MTRRQFLRLRRSGLGSSDAPAVVGVSPYRSRLEVYREKRGELTPQQTDTPLTEWGRRIEAPVAAWYRETTRAKLVRVPAPIRHPTYDYLFASPDRLIEPDGVLEIKCASPHTRQRWLDLGVPDHYLIQVQHQLMVTGRAYAVLAVLFDWYSPVAIRIERDEAMIRLIQQLEVDFWCNYVVPGLPPSDPPARLVEPLTQRLKERTQSQPGHAVVLGDEVRPILERLRELDRAISEADRERETLREELRVRLGTAERGVLPGLATVTWRTEVYHVIDRERLEREFPQAAAACVREQVRRPLRIHFTKGGNHGD